MNVIFVGIHNKTNILPLDNTTKSGKLIQRIIDKLSPIVCLKTNLYDIDYFPNKEEKYSLSLDWHKRIVVNSNDIVVLLGGEVHKNFITNNLKNIVKIPHPSIQRSYKAKDQYVLKSVEEISKYFS